jgi:hypothetical protein
MRGERAGNGRKPSNIGDPFWQFLARHPAELPIYSRLADLSICRLIFLTGRYRLVT